MSIKSPNVFKTTFIILTSFVIMMPAFAGTFYVRTDGNDANSGLENTPSGAWATIQKAADTINPSDIVEVQAGTYNEQVTITRSGLVNQLITFHANGQVIIDGQSTRPYCIKLDGADYIKIEGFTVRNSTNIGILIDNIANYNVIIGNTCHNNPNIGIKITNDSNYNTLSNNTLYNNTGGTNAYGNRISAIYVFNYSDYNIIDSNTCYSNSTGIWLEGRANNTTVTNNKSYSNFYGGIIVADTSYNTVTYNISHSNSAFGLEVCYSANNNLVKNNTIYNNGTNGIQLNNSAISNIIKNNIVTKNALNNSYNGVYITSDSSAQLLYNDIYNNGNNGNRNYGGVATQGAGDISLDPLFKSLDPISSDFLKLQSLNNGDTLESPCIDSGSPSDIPSVQSSKRIDIGAFDLYQHDAIAGGLLAEYFDNTNFTNLKLARIDPRINFDWGNSSPDASIGIDTFSSRWTGLIKIDYAQTYTFYLTTDDGSRLYIDNNLIIDKWFDQGPNEYSATINLTPGLHDIKYEYYENGGGAVAKLYWSAPSINKSLIPQDHLYYFGALPQDKYIQGGLKGTYSKFTNITSPTSYVFTRIDPQINFDWGYNMPDSALGQDLYQAKWKGKIRIPATDTYTFYTTTDDGVKLWVNNQLVVDNWRDQGATEYQGSAYFTPGLYDIELDYYENGGLAVAKLLWSSSTITKSVIPPTFLYYKNDLIIEEGGLYAEYFDNIDLTNPKIKRIDPNIDFDWLSASPDKLIEPDTYSIRWTGQVKADYSEVYTFYANSDDGLKLWVDNQLLISAWWDHGAYEISAPITLTAGWHDIKVEYFENGGHATARLFYSSPSTPKTVIPQDHLRTTLSSEDATLNFYSTLNSAQALEAPYIGHSASIIQTGTGQVTFEWAKFGKGALLNGTSDGVNKEMILLPSSDLNKKEGTIEFWFKPNWNSDDGIWHRFLCSTWNWDGAIEIFKYSNNSLYFKIAKDGVQHGIVSDASKKWNANTWHHLAFSYGPAGMKFYLDFNEIPISWTFLGESPYTGPMPDIFTSDLYLGGTYWGENPPDAIFDEVKIYNKQIIPSDAKAPVIAITSHYNNQVVDSSPVIISGTIDDNTAIVTVNGVPASVIPAEAGIQATFTSQPIDLVIGPNTITVIATDQSNNQSTLQITVRLTNLTGLWHLDENQGTAVSDSTGYDNDGTIYGATWVQRMPGSALQFDGVNDYLRINNSASLNQLGKPGSSYSIALWFNTNVRKGQSLTEKWPSTGGPYPWCIRGPSSATGKIIFALYDGTNNPGVWSLTNLDDSKWHYLVAVRDVVADKIRIYIDGALNGEAGDSTVGDISNTYSVIIGQRHGTGTDVFNGVIDEVKIYDRALTSQDIAEGYNQDIITFDRTQPTGTVVINSGAQYTKVREVTLTLSATDDLSGVSLMQISNNVDNWPDPPVAYQTTYPWTLSDGDGTKTVYVKFRDGVGNWSAAGAISDTIVLDSTRPAIPTVNTPISPTNINIQTLSGTKEANSSIWINGSEAVPLDSLTTWAEDVNLSEGTNNFSITSKDAAGNESQPPVEVTIILDTVLPTGTIKINNDAPYTNSRDVSLTLSATDTGTGVNQMRFSNNGSDWSPSEPYNPTKPWTLDVGDGTKVVYAQFSDFADNWSTVVSDDIILDTAAPIVDITSPQNGYISSTQTITVEGTIDDNEAAVTVNGSPIIVTNGTFTIEITLIEGANVITVIATDLADNIAQDSITVTYDATAPTTPVVTDDGDYANSLTTIHATWVSQDLESGISEYQYSIGTTQGGTDVIGWTTPTIPTDTEVTRNDLTLVAGTTYFINVKARNNALPISPSTWSEVGSSNGIIANEPTTVLSVAITSPANGARVNTSTITVSGTVSYSTATVTVNGILATVIPAEAGIQATFTAVGIPLTAGTNIITARAVKDTETATDTIDVILDLDPPSINIYTPDANATTRSNIVYGRVSDDTESVTVNGTPATVIPAEAGIQARFIARPTLAEGANTITVEAQDKATNINQASIGITYNTQSPKVAITLPVDNSEQNVSPINVQGTNTTDLSFIMVNSATASVIPAEAGIQDFTAERVTLDTTKTVITATGYDATDNKFQDAIVVSSPNLANYELIKISGDAAEDDPNRPSAGSNQTLKVKLEKNGLATASEEVQFAVTQGEGTVSPTSMFTDINGETQVTLTTDTDSDITNQIECFPTSNPLVKTTFYVDTKPAVPAVITKITDDTITPVPGVTIPLIVKLTDSNNNPIQDETINFQVISGEGTLSGADVIPEQAGIQIPTNYYGEAKVDLTCPNLGLVLTQIQASSSTVPSVTVTFNITTSAPLAITVQDIIDKVNYNDSKIQDIKADITVTSNAEFLPPTMQLKIWQKGDKQKVEEVSPTPQVKIRPPLETSTENVTMQREIISYDSSTNMYTVKTKQTGQIEEYPYQIDYVDYAKGVTLKTEYYSKEADDTINLYTIENSNFIQINDVWVFQIEIKTLYKNLTEPSYSTASTYSNIQINTGIPDSEF